MVAAGSEKLLVMKTSVLPDAGSLKRMRRRSSGFLTGVSREILVANDAGRAIRRRRIDAMSIDVRLGTLPGLVQHIKAGSRRSSKMAARRAYRGHERRAAIRDVDKTRNVAPQVEQRVHLHRRLGGAEVRPRKDRQAPMVVESGVDGIGQVQPQFFVDGVLAGDEPLGQRRMRQSRLSLASATSSGTAWRKPM